MKNKFILLTVCTFILSGCAGFHQLQTTPSVSLDRANFKMIRQVEGTETSVYILGIGGMSPWARNNNAINKMIKKAELKDNQAIAYISTRTNSHFYFPFGLIASSVTTVATGWVVEFTDGAAPQQNYATKPQPEIEAQSSPTSSAQQETVAPQVPEGGILLTKENGETFILTISGNNKIDARMAWDAYNFLINDPADRKAANYELLREYYVAAGINNASLLTNLRYRINKGK